MNFNEEQVIAEISSIFSPLNDKNPRVLVGIGDDAAVSAISGVTLAEGVTGPYDVIMRAEAPSMEDFGRMVLSKVQGVPGITRTLTCPVTY